MAFYIPLDGVFTGQHGTRNMNNVMHTLEVHGNRSRCSVACLVSRVCGGINIHNHGNGEADECELVDTVAGGVQVDSETDWTYYTVQ